jgi:DNA replication protein DnaC
LQRQSNLGPLDRLTFAALDSKGLSTQEDTQRRFAQAYQAASEYAEDPQGWLVLTGATGSGKTHLLAAVANRCLERAIPAFYISVPDLLDHLRSTFVPSSEVTYDQLFEHVRNAPVLALDDLGAHATSAWAQEKLNQILNHRFNRQLPTLIALNVSLDQLEEQLRARLEDHNLVLRILLGDKTSSHRFHADSLESEMVRRMTFETFDVRGNHTDATGRETLERALNSAKVFAEKPTDWLVFAGPTGCGKTHLAAAILNDRMRNGSEVRLEFVPDLLDYLRFTFSPQSSVTYDQFFEELRRSPLLLLDDLGAHSSTPWAEEKLYQIIVHRQETRLPTIITIRGLMEDLPLPKAVQSRLMDARLVTWVPITAPDYRDSGASQRPQSEPAKEPPRSRKRRY